jgi:hypothetical protein
VPDNPLKDTNMTQECDNSNWRDGLAADLSLLYRDGLTEDIEPIAAPVLAELALAVSGETYRSQEGFYRFQIEDLLCAAIRRQEKTRKRRLGLEKLFGIAGEKTVLGLEDRRDDAAPFFGYRSKDTLRRGEVNGRPFEDVAQENLLRQMLALADEHGFAYTAPYDGAEPSATATTTAHQKPMNSSPPEPAPSVEPTGSADTRRPTPRRPRWWHVAIVVGAALIAGAALLLVVGASGSGQTYRDKWGPIRPVYNYKLYIGNNHCDDGTNPSAYNGRCGAPADFPVFNSFINTPYYGDETEFFDGYRAEQSNGGANDPIRNVTNGDRIVVLRIYVDNDTEVREREPELTTAYNARVRVTLPANTSKSLVAYASISADRAITISDSVDLTSDRSFSLEYIPGSAVLYNRANGDNRTFQLSDEIIGSEGALIGVNSMNGVLPPSNDFSGTLVELKVRAVPQTNSQ